MRSPLRYGPPSLPYPGCFPWPLAEHDFVILENDGERVQVKADGEAQLLVLSGEPIDEPVVQYGPFVMSTEAEIIGAFHDLSAGKFGHLDE